jgi:hypothetical protein
MGQEQFSALSTATNGLGPRGFGGDSWRRGPGRVWGRNWSEGYRDMACEN